MSTFNLEYGLRVDTPYCEVTEVAIKDLPVQAEIHFPVDSRFNFDNRGLIMQWLADLVGGQDLFSSIMGSSKPTLSSMNPFELQMLVQAQRNYFYPEALTADHLQFLKAYASGFADILKVLHGEVAKHTSSPSTDIMISFSELITVTNDDRGFSGYRLVLIFTTKSD